MPEREEEAVFITITNSKVTAAESAKVDAFLAKFLPRMKSFPGVAAIYHYNRLDQGEETTIVIWEDEAAVKRYRESALIKEALAYERQLNLPATREGYPLAFAAIQNR